jgi:hypothetical protein
MLKKELTMRAKVAKMLRRLAKNSQQNPETTYKTRKVKTVIVDTPNGPKVEDRNIVTLEVTCERGIYQQLKKAYKLNK